MTESTGSARQAWRIATVRETLEHTLRAERVEVVDVSGRHKGHAEARDGRAHFEVTVVSPVFEGDLPLARHRRVYAALGSLMDTDIHALKITALTPERADASSSAT